MHEAKKFVTVKDYVMARILVVDDDLTVRELVILLAERDGHEVFSVENGIQAIKMLRDRPVDLVITDIMMPELDGFGVVQVARKVQPDARVIVASAVGEKVPEHLTEAAFRKLGVDRFVPKPFRAATLRAAIREALA